jgi:hypothetical protein
MKLFFLATLAQIFTLLLLLLALISLNYNHQIDVAVHSENGHQLSLNSLCLVEAVVPPVTTNAADKTAMLAIRRSFSNFTNSNWYMNDDPCNGTGEKN